MSNRALEGSWQSPTALLSLSARHVPVYVGQQGLGTQIIVQSNTTAIPGEIQYPFTPPLNLSQFKEICFWLHSSRPGDGSSNKPFYLAFEAVGSGSQSWKWLLPNKQRDHWELHRLWLGDMPEGLRQSVSAFKLRSLDATLTFTAIIGDLIAVTPEPLQDVDTALLKRLHNRFQVQIQNVAMNVPAIIDVPENRGDRTLPHILITPWSVQASGQQGGSGEIVDSYRCEINGGAYKFTGAYVRPMPGLIQLEYSIDVYAEERSQKTRLLDTILTDLIRQPFLVVNGEPLPLIAFMPAPEQMTEFATPGRTPLFYRLAVPIETGDRRFQLQAQPFVLVNSSQDRESSEAVQIMQPV